MKRALSIACVAIAAGAGCSSAESPKAFYERYYAKSAAGISTLEEDAKHYSARKRAEVEQKIPLMMQGMGKSREEVSSIYLSMSKAVARCKKIELASEEITGGVAVLNYRQTDVCGNMTSGPEKHKVRLVDESGWKIDHVEVSL
jgi:hypothetical protein